MSKSYNKRDHLGCPRDGRENKKILCRETFSTFESLIEEFFSTLIPEEGGLVAWLLLSRICSLDFDRSGIYANNCPHGLWLCEHTDLC